MIVVRAGARLDPVDYEALGQLGLLETPDRRAQDVLRAFLASIVVMVMLGLYLARFPDTYYTRARFLAVLAAIFLVTLAGARLFAGQYTLYPSAAMALTLVIITRNEIAIICTVGLGLLVGIMANNSLEIAMMVTPDGHSRLELSRFISPPVIADHRKAPVNALGYLRAMFAVEDLDETLERLQNKGAVLVGDIVQYEHLYRLCYIRGPESLLIGLAEQLTADRDPFQDQAD